ncbi:uncharacterized protein B0I36DRAFT_332282 [Microdochium trichocladiopsis]|uniref:Uncharacterized protein n=1 Tax=Microdochium trichocladiopsis TaxID=1682393 RepID=A0A9P8XY60_9PEZI|nr:uncharacterized protein B0I36DRAFT_332282 [Microdochium trichocladiopsis]KAH7024947.1 hypothetical protein B0I36DRAFT_332282 [Microdochium trichocladiopsis]
MSNHDHDIFCSICGDSFLVPHVPEPDEENDGVGTASSDEVEDREAAQWRSEAALLSDPANEFDLHELHYRAGKRKTLVPPPIELDVDDVEIRIEPATFVRRNVFRIHAAGGSPSETAEEEEVETNDHVGHDEHGRWLSTYRIAVHAACLRVAQDFIRAQKRSSVATAARVTSMRTLWKALRMRWETLDAMLMLSNGSMGAPAFSVLRKERVYQYPPFVEYPQRDPSCPSLFAGPEKMAACIVNMAVPRGREALDWDAWWTSFRARFDALPQELQDIITGLMASGGDMAFECNRLVSNESWSDMLVRGHVLPFIGALDRDALLKAEKTRISAGDGGDGNQPSLDWEKLVRWLTKESSWVTTVWTYKISGWSEFRFSVPDDLWSRKWRWELLQHMFVCDVLPRHKNWMIRETDLVAIPRYWDEAGRRVYPIERLSGEAASES